MGVNISKTRLDFLSLVKVDAYVTKSRCIVPSRRLHRSLRGHGVAPRRRRRFADEQWNASHSRRYCLVIRIYDLPRVFSRQTNVSMPGLPNRVQHEARAVRWSMATLSMHELRRTPLYRFGGFQQRWPVKD